MKLMINIDVPDLDSAIDFYQCATELRLVRRLFDGMVAEMLGASSPIYLLQKKPDSPSSTDTWQLRNYDRHWTPVHLDFIVTDIGAAVDAAVAAGALLEGEINIFNWGKLATLSDPFGHGLCFIEWIGTGYQ